MLETRRKGKEETESCRTDVPASTKAYLVAFGTSSDSTVHDFLEEPSC